MLSVEGVSTYCTVCQAKKKNTSKTKREQKNLAAETGCILFSEWTVSGRDLVVESEATNNMTMDQEMFVRFDEKFEGPYSNASFSETNFRER